MRTLIPLLLFTLASAALHAAPSPVNFKVGTLSDGREESLGRKRPYITVGSRKICFMEPQFCEMTSSPESLTVYLKKPGQSGQFTVSNSAFKAETDLFANVDDFQKAALATLPKDAEKVVFSGASDRVYVVNQWKSNTFDFTYVLYGKPMRCQIAYINIDPEHQICLKVLAEEESAAAALGMAKRFMNSWFWGDGL